MDLWIHFGIALGLGLLVGLQRERVLESGPGIRTFPLITLFGSLCGVLASDHGAWILATGLLALGVLMALENLHRGRSGEASPGPTTEISALVMYGVGALLVTGHTALALAVGGTVALLLQWKKPLHGFVIRIGEDELHAVFRLVLIGLVVLPVLPDRTFGPYEVLNPFHIWLMVVLIVGISLAGYIGSRIFGAGAGSLLAGIFGGLISSTATTVSYARRSRKAPGASPLAALVIMIASTIVFVRVAVEVAVTAPSVLSQVLPQFAAMTLIMGLISAAAWVAGRRESAPQAGSEDPTDLKAAVFFGLLYAAVLFGLAAAREHFGSGGLYLVSALSGLTDMDAITLSTSHMIQNGRLEASTGWRMMLVGALSNIAFKGAMVAALGSRRLLLRIAALFGLSILGGLALLWLWP